MFRQPNILISVKRARSLNLIRRFIPGSRSLYLPQECEAAFMRIKIKTWDLYITGGKIPCYTGGLDFSGYRPQEGTHLSLQMYSPKAHKVLQSLDILF